MLTSGFAIKVRWIILYTSLVVSLLVMLIRLIYWRIGRLFLMFLLEMNLLLSLRSFSGITGVFLSVML